MVDPDAFLNAISPDSPCGENLEYDPLFGEMERAAIGKPEQQFGSTIIPAKDPKWREVQKHALELLTRTHDLRVATELARADLVLAGLAAFCRDLELIRSYVERYWDTVHPQLDPEDGNDPASRINILESLCDEEKTLRLLRLTPLVSSRTVGEFNLRDVAVANGELQPTPGTTEPANWMKINVAFAESAVEDLESNARAIGMALEHVVATERIVAEHVGAESAVNLSPLLSLLQAAGKIFTTQLVNRGASGGIEQLPSGAEESASEFLGADGEISDVGTTTMQHFSDEITTRDDVLIALDRICDYYVRFEPSSPLPLLLQRCKRLVSASFLEIIHDLVPGAEGQISAMGGMPEEGHSE